MRVHANMWYKFAGKVCMCVYPCARATGLCVHATALACVRLRSRVHHRPSVHTTALACILVGCSEESMLRQLAGSWGRGLRGLHAPQRRAAQSRRAQKRARGGGRSRRRALAQPPTVSRRPHHRARQRGLGVTWCFSAWVSVAGALFAYAVGGSSEWSF